MGTDPHELLNKLYSDPYSLVWSVPREVHVLRGKTGKLGLRFKTVQSASQDTSSTVVVLVRNTCVVQAGQLKSLDRILKINGINLTNKNEDDVDAIFQDKKLSRFNLEVQSEVSSKCKVVTKHDCNSESMNSGSYQPGFAGSTPKRMLSVTSSGQSSTCSMERPPSKRIVKSNSTDTERSGGQHSDEPCSPPVVAHPLAPTHDVLDSALIPDVLEYPRTMSLPDHVSLAKIGIEIDDGEKIHSLPLANGSRPSAKHGCDNGVGAVKLDIRRCKNKSCNVAMDSCLWHSLIFKVPQFVIWDPMSKTITLNRGSNTSFGITKKVKIQEATSQIYTLVEAIQPGSVAASHDLFVGDWIQSINRQPLQRRDEAHRAQFDDLTEVRLVIQRPEGILQKAQEHADKIMKQHQQQKQKMTPLMMPQRRGVSDTNFTPSPGLSMYPNSRSVLTNVSPVWVGPAGQQDPVERVMYWRHSEKHTNDKHGMSASSPICEPQLRGVPSPRSLEVWCKNCGTESPSNISHPSPPHSPEDNCNPLYHQGSSSPTSPTDGIVPCSRVFICGNAANHLANMLMSGSPASTTVMQDTHTQLVKLSLKKFDSRKVSVDIWQQRRSVPRDQHRVLNGTGYFSTSSSSGCVQCGGDVACVNVELFVVQDDNFFHHSSHYLFTKDCLFIIAFDAQKILTNMSTDIARLEQLLHSIQSYVGNMTHISVYGIFSLDDDEDKGDEVRTMFYANDRQHGKYSVSIPHIVFVDRSNVQETTGELCTKMMKHALSYGPKVRSRTQHVSEALSSMEHESRTVWQADELRQQIFGHYPHYKDLILQADVVAELEQMGCLQLLTGKSSGSPKAVSLQAMFVHPVSVYYRLVRMCIDSKDVLDGELMFHLSMRGVLLQSELFMLLQDIVPDVERFTQYLKTQGIVYDIGPSEICQGNDRNIFIPYFLEELTAGSHKLTVSNICLLVVFGGTTPWTIFYKLMAAIGQHQECVQMKFLRSGLCAISLWNLSLKLLFDNMKDTIVITVDRGCLSGKEMVLMQLFQQLLAHVVPPDLHYILGPPCPLQECPPHIQGHVVNLATPTIRCGHVCLNDYPNIKKWIVSESQQSDSTSVKHGQKTSCLSQNILKLPPSVFQEIANKLMIPHGRDWRHLAGLLGKTSEEVMIYEIMLQGNSRLPSEQLLIDWNQMEQGSIRQLIAHLTEMERFDVRKIITDHLEIDMQD